MRPRVVFSTHYQVDEPAYMEFLVKLCTSPVQSTYREVVEQKFAEEIKSRGKDFNIAAGRYAVDLARALDLITPNNTWTEKGHLVNLVAQIDCTKDFEAQLTLTLPEKLLHFRVFLEADGAALLFMAHRLTKDGSLLNSDTTWNTLAREMFVDTFLDYLAITNNSADRVRLRQEIDRIRTRGYEGNSGSHKIFIHIQTLYRLGLVTRPDPTGRVYQLQCRSLGTLGGLQILLEEVPDVPTLEKVIGAHKWLEVAAKVFEIGDARSSGNSPKITAAEILSIVASHYRRVISTGVPLCPLSTLVEAAQIDLLVGHSLSLDYDEIVNLLSDAQRERPKDIGFHVDRRGRPAFIRLSDNMVDAYA
jgi:hypothetical protein